jgi:hypothetical protein
VPPRASKRPAHALYVSIVSANVETLDRLQAYFGAAGVHARCTRAVHDLEHAAPTHATATVIFPDELDLERVCTFVRELRRHRPRTLALIVTREPQRFHALSRDDGRSPAPVVLPRPSFGWELLDAIRAHAATLH